MSKPTWFVVVLSLLALASRASASGAGLEPGSWLDQSSSAAAQDLLPSEFLGRYERGEWKHQVVEPKPGVLVVDPEWVAAGKENQGRFKLDENGSIRRADDGSEPASIYGAPFPTIDANDPEAATKLIWNYFYNYWTIGNNRTTTGLTWVSQGGRDREATNTVYQRFWDGQKPHRTPAENPLNLLYQQFVTTDAPADLEGINTLNWRYRDQRRDSTWSYVPALRRVRQVTPTNRADGFLGSDMSQDDGGYFDAKPEDFTWRLVGEGEQLFLFDRAAVVEGGDTLQPLPQGGWRASYDSVTRFNFQKPDFDAEKELAWAPVTDGSVLVKRPVWILEGTPKDRFYLYGKIVLRIDKEDFSGFGSYTSKYDWQGNLINSYLSGGARVLGEEGRRLPQLLGAAVHHGAELEARPRDRDHSPRERYADRVSRSAVRDRGRRAREVTSRLSSAGRAPNGAPLLGLCLHSEASLRRGAEHADHSLRGAIRRSAGAYGREVAPLR